VQDFAPDDDGSEEANDVFVVVTCLACGHLHFVNPKTGKTPSQRSE
jgi:RNase P subunit RPR2